MRTMFQDKTSRFGVPLLSMLLLPVFAGCGPQAQNIEGGDAPIEMEAQRSELQEKAAAERLPEETGTESKDRIVLDEAGGAFIERVRGPMPIVLRESVKVGPPLRADDDGSFTTAALIGSYDPNAIIDSQGTINYSGGLFGASYDVIVGQSWCGNGMRRAYGDVTYGGDGWCTARSWVTSSIYDCRMWVHIGVGPFRGGSCAWAVYSTR